MQTFLPYPNFQKSAACLDNKRLGKQRVEGYQILKLLKHKRKHPKTKRGWINHPAVLMWTGCEHFLRAYIVAMCREWKARGFKDRLESRIKRMKIPAESLMVIPGWYGNPIFHRSHRSNLLRKEPEHYRQYWPKLSAELLYVWPTDSPLIPDEHLNSWKRILKKRLDKKEEK